MKLGIYRLRWHATTEDNSHQSSDVWVEGQVPIVASRARLGGEGGLLDVNLFIPLVLILVAYKISSNVTCGTCGHVQGLNPPFPFQVGVGLYQLVQDFELAGINDKYLVCNRPSEDYTKRLH